MTRRSRRWRPGVLHLAALTALSGCGAPAPLPGNSDGGATDGPGPSLACPTTVQPGPGIVFSEVGPLQGVAAGGTWKYLGVPFAAPPVGPARWRAPGPPACRGDLRVADKFGPQCPQLDDNNRFVGTEDCLFLNLWTPKSAPPAGGWPVLFFIHGGGHVQGSASAEATPGQPLYDGQTLAEGHGAVVVTANYRLGVFGYLAHPALGAESPTGLEGNHGTLDQIAALGFVQRNIGAFGGDPKRVMIFGQSAGGVAVCALVATGLARGLFAGAVMQSGACTAATKPRAEQLGQAVVAGAGCAAANDVAACLRRLTPEAAVRAAPVRPDVAGLSQQYTSVIDGYVFRDHPLSIVQRGEHNRVPFVIGSNSDETSRAVPMIAGEAQYRAAVLAFAGGNQPMANSILAVYPVTAYPTPRAAYVAVTSDAKFTCSARIAARAAVQGQSPAVFRYLFSQPLQNAPLLRSLGAWHGLDLFFVFRQLTVGGYSPSQDEIALADAMQGYWTRFGASGDPSANGAVPWPRYTIAGDDYLQLQAGGLQSRKGWRAKECDFWDTLR